jgi:hypothetical protein
MITYLCCPHNPILLDGSLVFVCEHEMPRVLKDESGFFILHQGEKVLFNNLKVIGKQHTSRFGELINYKEEK